MFDLIDDKVYKPLEVLWLVVRKLARTEYDIGPKESMKLFEDTDEHYIPCNYLCTKKDYDHYESKFKDSKRYYKKERTETEIEKYKNEIKTALDVGDIILDIPLGGTNYNTFYIYIQRNDVTLCYSLNIQRSKNDNNNKYRYFFNIKLDKERNMPLFSVFNFSSKKTGAKNEYMYGPMFKYSKGTDNGTIGQYNIINNVSLNTYGYNSRKLLLSEDICNNIDKYDTEFDFVKSIWIQDILIVDSYRDMMKFYKKNYDDKDTNIDHTLLFWSNDFSHLENLKGNKGYKYIVIGTHSIFADASIKIINRHKELIKNGEKPVLPNDETWVQQEGSQGNDNDDETYNQCYNYSKINSEDPYFVQAVYEADLKDRETYYDCLRVVRVKYDNDYYLENNDYYSKVIETRKT